MTKTVLTIDGRRTGYSIDQVLEYEGTMTVKELIEYLEQFDDDTPVLINNDNGYTYGEIKESSFRDEETEDEEETEDDK